MTWLSLGLLLFTMAVYYGIKSLYRRKPKIYLSPLLLTPAVVIVLLLQADIPYETYNAGAHWLTDMIGPATIALAVPLYKNVALLRKYAVEIMASVLVGSAAGVATSVWIAKGLHLDGQIIDGLVLRSTTTPIAIAITDMIGGIPAMTALFVLVTGLLGTVVGPMLIRLFRIRSGVAQGVLLGTSAHTAGTTTAFEFGAVSGTVSSISMLVAALLALVVVPWLVLLL
ncbi:LrgB family protein [Paenibacillus tyrfis]|uniref:LrgB family protein n=1 Tax=Paenibacillus tyrfis TaxID=1501230 RepID=UPI00209F3EB7|nr:LrgB family protein [Paenibacillus tyrfis]MCP1310308.1 LrgB family protein [Paenibacillus tyrfis]